MAQQGGEGKNKQEKSLFSHSTGSPSLGSPVLKARNENWFSFETLIRGTTKTHI